MEASLPGQAWEMGRQSGVVAELGESAAFASLLAVRIFSFAVLGCDLVVVANAVVAAVVDLGHGGQVMRRTGEEGAQAM